MFLVFLSWLCCSGGYEPTSFSANLLGCCQLCSGAVQKYQVALGLIRALSGPYWLILIYILEEKSIV